MENTGKRQYGAAFRRQSPAGKIADILILMALAMAGLFALYPFLYVLCMSISDPMEALKMTITFYPKGFSLVSYGMILENGNVWLYYYNTLWYTAVGLVFNIIVTVTFAYPLSRHEFCLRKPVMVYMSIPMFFSGGMIPSFLVISRLGLYNTRWALILPGAMSIWVAVMTRVYFQTTIPDSVVEAAKIDGCNDLRILASIVAPLSKPIIAVIGLYNAVSFWNLYLNAVIYLANPKLQPLQVYLQRIVIGNMADVSGNVVGKLQRNMYGNQMKYAIIIFSLIPILCVYPMLQKYFVKGVMVGSLKG